MFHFGLLRVIWFTTVVLRQSHNLNQLMQQTMHNWITLFGQANKKPLWYVTRHQCQLSLLRCTEKEISSGQNAIMLYG